MRPPGFKVGFYPAGGYHPRWSPRVLWSPQAFPFDLGSLSGIEDLMLQGSKVTGDKTAYRITGTATNRLVGNIGSYMQASTRGQIIEVEIWINQEDLLPLRIETRFEEMDGGFRAIFSDFGAKYDITVTEEILGKDSPVLPLLRAGELSPEERGQLVRAFPVEGQACLEEELGTDAYQKVLSGNSGADRVFWMALDFCEQPIFSSKDDYFPLGVARSLYVLDVSSLSIVPRGNRKFQMECLRDTIGLEELFEIGWGEREPTPEEVAAAAMCRWYRVRQGNRSGGEWDVVGCRG